MTKLLYLAAMALLGLGLTMAQNASPQSDSSNSSKTSQTQNSTAPTHAKPGSADRSATDASKRHQQEAPPNTTVQDQQNSTTSTTGASGESNSQPSSSTMGTTGSTPESENPDTGNKGATIPQNSTPADQQPNSSSNPNPHLVMNSQGLNSTPAARAVATHTPDPGTCMNPASVNGQDPSTASRPSCD